MKKIWFVFAISCSINVWASDLLLVTGHARGDCGDPTLITQARRDAKQKAGEAYEMLGKWKEATYDIEMYGFCVGTQAWTEGLFKRQDSTGRPYFLKLESGVSNPRINEDVPGANKWSDEEAWKKAIDESHKRVLDFCSSIEETQILSRSKKVFEGRSWYDYFTVEVKHRCSI
jgi:hypothetical protein